MGLRFALIPLLFVGRNVSFVEISEKHRCKSRIAFCIGAELDFYI